MPAEVKTNAIMPKGDTNGLSAIAADLVREAKGEAPPRLRAVICLVDARRATVDKDTGDWSVTVRVRRAEVLLQGDQPEAEKLIRRALEARTGQAVLSLELERDLEAAFADFDPDAPAEPGDPGAVVDVEIVDDDDGDGEPGDGDDLDSRDDGEWD